MKVIRMYGIKYIVFSNDDGMFQKYKTSEYVTHHVTSGFKNI